MAATHIIVGGGGGASGGGSPLSELADNPFSELEGGKKKSRHSLHSFFLGTLLGNFFFLICVSMSLWLLGAGAWMAAGCGDYSCEDYPSNFESSLWLSWGLHFDPGTQTGINAMELYPQKWVATSFSILGFLLNLVFLGLIVENIRVLLDSWRRTHGRIIENEHTVVLGWTDKTLFLLGELAEMMTDSQRGGGTIVVLGELDTLEMRMEVSIAFPDWQKRWSKVRVRYYNGKPYEVDDLLKVAVYAAERVIVLGCSRRPRVADSQMLTTICALRCLPGAKYLTKSTNVIAELKQPQNEPVVCHVGGEGERDTAAEAPAGAPEAASVASDHSIAEQAGHPLSITPVVGNHAANAIMGLCALDPSAGLALLDLMNFSGDQIETIPCSTFTAKGPTTFGVLRNSFAAATPLGVKFTEGERGGKDASTILLAPSDDYVVNSDAQLLVIAADISSALASSKLAAAVAEKNAKKATVKRPGEMVRAAGRFVRSATSMKIPLGRGLLSQVGVDPGGLDEVSTLAGLGRSNYGSGNVFDNRRCLIFIGWQRGFESLLRLLDARLPKNSEVHILSEQTMLNRTLELNSEGLALDGSPMERKEGEEEPDEQDKEMGLQNCRLIHYAGYTTDERAMRRLPLNRADAAVVVADANEDDVEALGGAELQIADSEALTSTILLRRLRGEIERDHPHCPPLTVVTEFVDLLTRRLLERQPTLITSAPKPKRRPKGMRRGDSVQHIGGFRPNLHGNNTQRVDSPCEEPLADAPTPSPTPLVSGGAGVSAPSAAAAAGAGSAGGAGGALSKPRPEVQSVVFHRNYIETTALSLASHSDTSWTTVQMLLDPNSGQVIKSLPIQHAITIKPNEAPPALPSATGKTEPEVPGCYYSFADLSDIIVSQSLGLLIGWRRGGGEVIINPPEKVRPVMWLHGDELIVLKRS